MTTANIEVRIACPVCDSLLAKYSQGEYIVKHTRVDSETRFTFGSLICGKCGTPVKLEKRDG